MKMNNHSLDIVLDITDNISIVFISLLISLSSIWVTLLIGKLFFVYSSRNVQVRWLSRQTKINEVKKIVLYLIILTFCIFAVLFHTAQELKLYPIPIETNCSEEIIEIDHLYDGLSHLCILMTISFVNITTVFFQKLYSKSKDLRLVRTLVIFNVLIKLPFLFTIGLFAYSYNWVELVVIVCIFIEYLWLIRNEMYLRRIIKANLRDLESYSLKSQTNWREKRSINRNIFITFFLGSSFFFVSLPIKWVRAYIDISTRDCDDTLPLQKYFGKSGTIQIKQVLIITINILYIPLILMLVGLICFTIYFLLTKLKKQIQTMNKRENNHLIEGLIQH